MTDTSPSTRRPPWLPATATAMALLAKALALAPALAAAAAAAGAEEGACTAPAAAATAPPEDDVGLFQRQLQVRRQRERYEPLGDWEVPEDRLEDGNIADCSVLPGYELCDCLPTYDWGIGPRYFGCKGPFELLMGTWEGQGTHWTILPTYFPMMKAAFFRNAGSPEDEIEDIDGMKFREVLDPSEYKGWFNDFVIVGEIVYNDTITVKPLRGPILNRADFDGEYFDKMTMHALSYTQAVLKANTTRTLGEDHFETGMLLFEMGSGNEATSLPMRFNEPVLRRVASNPHGISILSKGGYEVYKGLDAKEELVRQLEAIALDTAPQPQACIPSFRETSLNMVLADYARALPQVDLFVKMSLNDTQLSQLTFLNKNATASDFTSTFWISRVTEADGSRSWVLQYAQVSMISFLPRPDCFTCAGKEPMEDGCAAKKDMLLGACAFDKDAPGLDSAAPSCAEQSMVKWPHLQVSSLRLVDPYDPSQLEANGPPATPLPY